MARVKVSLSLPDELAAKARALAGERGLNLSAFIAALIEAEAEREGLGEQRPQ